MSSPCARNLYTSKAGVKATDLGKTGRAERSKAVQSKGAKGFLLGTTFLQASMISC